MANLESQLSILSKAVLDALTERQSSVSFAESCTGGLLSQYLTSLPGSSAVYKGAIVAYSNAAKSRFLGIPQETIKIQGAVSEKVATLMAIGAQKEFQSTFALSVTGIAGPDGGTPAKPVGTVWIGLANPETVEAKLLQLDGDRSTIRALAGVAGLTWLLQEVKKCT